MASVAAWRPCETSRVIRRASRTVEARSGEYLGPRWRQTEVEAEVSQLGPFALVSLDLEAFDDEPSYLVFGLQYFLRIGPPHQDRWTIEAFVEVPDGMGFSKLGAWDSYDYELRASWRHDDEPGDMLNNAVYEGDADALLESLQGMGGTLVELRPASSEED